MLNRDNITLQGNWENLKKDCGFDHKKKMIVTIIIIRKPLASEDYKTAEAVQSGKLSNRKFLLNICNTIITDSPKCDFLYTAVLDLPRREIRHIESDGSSSKKNHQKKPHKFYNIKGKYKYLDLYWA